MYVCVIFWEVQVKKRPRTTWWPFWPPHSLGRGFSYVTFLGSSLSHDLEDTPFSNNLLFPAKSDSISSLLLQLPPASMEAGGDPLASGYPFLGSSLSHGLEAAPFSNVNIVDVRREERNYVPLRGT